MEIAKHLGHKLLSALLSMRSRNSDVKNKNSKPLKIFGRTYSIDPNGMAEIHSSMGNDPTASNADLKKVGELDAGRLSASNRYDARVHSDSTSRVSHILEAILKALYPLASLCITQLCTIQPRG